MPDLVFRASLPDRFFPIETSHRSFTAKTRTVLRLKNSSAASHGKGRFPSLEFLRCINYLDFSPRLVSIAASGDSNWCRCGNWMKSPGGL